MQFRDRVKQTTATTGTGAYTISALAVPGSTTFAASFSDGATVPYCCASETDYEVGIGTYTAATNSLSRDTILSSSNSGAAVNWGAGDKDIFCTVPATAMPVYRSTNPTVTTNPAFTGARWINTSTGEQFVCIDATVGNNKWVGSLGTYVVDTTVGLLIDYDFVSGISGSTVIDQCGNHNGAISGATRVVDGLYFDGNDYINCGVVDFPTSECTLWVVGRSDDFDGHRGVSGMDQTSTSTASALFYHKVADTNKNLVFLNASTANPRHNGFSFNFCSTFDGVSTCNYWYGDLASTTATSGFHGSGIPTGPLYVGCGVHNRVRADFFIGTLRAFRLYNRALTPAEVWLLSRTA